MDSQAAQTPVPSSICWPATRLPALYTLCPHAVQPDMPAIHAELLLPTPDAACMVLNAAGCSRPKHIHGDTHYNATNSKCCRSIASFQSHQLRIAFLKRALFGCLRPPPLLPRPPPGRSRVLYSMYVRPPAPGHHTPICN